MRKAALALSIVALLLGGAEASAGSGKVAQVNVEPTNAADASGDASLSSDDRDEARDAAGSEPEAGPAAAPTAPSRRQAKRGRGYNEYEAYERAEAAAYERQSRAEAYRSKMQALGLPDCDTLRGYARSFSGYYE